MHDIRVLSSGDMTLCMNLSGHTSTLPCLVVQGRVFEASLLQSGFGQKTPHLFTFMTEGMVDPHTHLDCGYAPPPTHPLLGDDIGFEAS